jgi:glucoamylase
LSKPALPNLIHPTNAVEGYHIVWLRDLYAAAIGLLAAGDIQTPVDVLHFFARTQNSDGTWPESLWASGRPTTSDSEKNVIQTDLVALPLLLAGQLQDRKVYTLNREVLEMVRKATSFLISHGPSSRQDRWGSSGEYIPAILAKKIAALKTASALTHDPFPGIVANEWQSSIEKWTLVPNGPHGSNYYVRANPKPELDEGFFELVRMGVRDSRDPRILKTLEIYDQLELQGIKNTGRTTNKESFVPLLAAERGELAVALGQFDKAREQLHLLEKTVTSNYFIPERLFPHDSSPLLVRRLGVACPFVWAHAEDIILHRSIVEGTVFDTPRYK